MYIYYSRGTSPTGRAIRDALGIAGGINPPADRQDHLIRWGNSGPVRFKPENYYNSRGAIAKATNKLGALKTMRSNHVTTPDLFEVQDSNSLPVEVFPLLGRAVNHTQGKDIVLCMQREDVDRALSQGRVSYFVRYVPTSREFRVHVFRGEILKISEKVLTEPDLFSMPWVRNFKNGYTFRNPRDIPEVLMNRIRDEAVAGVQALGLDFGAVDVIIGDDNRVYVLEVNTGPSLAENSLEVYVRKFAEVLGIENFTLPEVQDDVEFEEMLDEPLVAE